MNTFLILAALVAFLGTIAAIAVKMQIDKRLHAKKK